MAGRYMAVEIGGNAVSSASSGNSRFFVRDVFRFHICLGAKKAVWGNGHASGCLAKWLTTGSADDFSPLFCGHDAVNVKFR